MLRLGTGPEYLYAHGLRIMTLFSTIWFPTWTAPAPYGSPHTTVVVAKIVLPSVLGEMFVILQFECMAALAGAASVMPSPNEIPIAAITATIFLRIISTLLRVQFDALCVQNEHV